MTREALETAVSFWERSENSRELEPDEQLIVAAARRQLALMPELVDDPECGDCDHLPRKAYPPETVEKIAEAIIALHITLIEKTPSQLAIAVLDALGELP